MSVVKNDSDVGASQLSVSQTVHVLDIERQLVVERLVSVPLVPALRLEGEQLPREDETYHHNPPASAPNAHESESSRQSSRQSSGDTISKTCFSVLVNPR
ncbi:hypothetical protein EYF80_051438 [Liparis tanakae]|uniref:Uncharacterized protein n=1 Tax=Liparis tanakae TaxID=230148 RepID=A0A4Z2FB72_9TELE|nr:hypothetical protein EYF80_051438 [Liparis tanakae]